MTPEQIAAWLESPPGREAIDAMGQAMYEHERVPGEPAWRKAAAVREAFLAQAKVALRAALGVCEDEVPLLLRAFIETGVLERCASMAEAQEWAQSARELFAGSDGFYRLGGNP